MNKNNDSGNAIFPENLPTEIIEWEQKMAETIPPSEKQTIAGQDQRIYAHTY